MASFRTLLLRHRTLALLVIAAALAMKALVPAGFMVESGAKTITVAICADTLGARLTTTISVPLTGKSTSQSGEHAKDGGCPFGALGMASLGAADPVLLAAAIAFVLALGFAPPPTRGAAPRSYVRPPLRGPPTLA